MKLVAAAVIIEKGKVLLTRRKSGEKLEGFWEFPGGKIENDETLHECLEREIKEELGIKSSAKDILCESIYRYAHGEFKIIAISTELYTENFILNSHDKACWVKIEELLEYKLLPADVPIAKKIMELNHAL